MRMMRWPFISCLVPLENDTGIDQKKHGSDEMVNALWYESCEMCLSFSDDAIACLIVLLDMTVLNKCSHSDLRRKKCQILP